MRCLAALLDLEVAEVPNFCYGDNAEWFSQADEWLSVRGYRLVDIGGCTSVAIRAGAYFIASGKSPRGDFNHSVICSVDGDSQFILAMDPHPSGAGLDGPFTMATFVIKA